MGIRKTEAGKFRADVNAGGKRKSKLFTTLAAARAWERETREAMTNAGAVQVEAVIFADVLIRYRDQVSPHKAGARWEINRINRFVKDDPMALIPLLQLHRRDAIDYIDRRRGKVQPSSVSREMTLLKSALRKACEDWFDIAYPWNNIVVEGANASRDRLITDAEVEAIVQASGYQIGSMPTNWFERTGAMFLFAIETAMRIGEIARLQVRHLDMSRRVAILPKEVCTKTGHAREVPLSPVAIRILDGLPADLGQDDLCFGQGSRVAGQAFTRLREKCGFKDKETWFTFHDTRHLACTRLSRIPGMSAVKLAAITGHKSGDMLQRYYNEDMSKVADLIDLNDRVTLSGDERLQEMITSAGSVEELIRQLTQLQARQSSTQ